MVWIARIALALAVVAIAALCIPQVREGRVILLVLALVLGVASAAPPLEFRRQASPVPRINDISTNFANPAFADEQRKGYPDLLRAPEVNSSYS